MFHQFHVKAEDQDSVFCDRIESQPSLYRMKVHLFRAPSCANYCLKYLAAQQYCYQVHRKKLLCWRRAAQCLISRWSYPGELFSTEKLWLVHYKQPRSKGIKSWNRMWWRNHRSGLNIRWGASRENALGIVVQYIRQIPLQSSCRGTHAH